MIIISAQPNRQFSFSGGAQKKCKEKKKTNYSVLIAQTISS